MQSIKFFLAERQNLAPKQILIKRTLAQIIRQHFDEEVSPDNIRVTRDTIYLSASPALKNALHIKHKMVLKELSETIKQTFNQKTV